MKALYTATKKDKDVQKEQAAQLLIQHNIKFTVTGTGGYYLIVRHKESTIDFWVSTGLWKVRSERIRGRGIFPLLRQLGISA